MGPLDDEVRTLPASVAKTDRELLLQINERMSVVQQEIVELRQEFVGPDGVCNRFDKKIAKVTERVEKNERWQIYITGGLVLLGFLVGAKMLTLSGLI